MVLSQGHCPPTIRARGILTYGSKIISNQRTTSINISFITTTGQVIKNIINKLIHTTNNWNLITLFNHNNM